MHHLRRTCIFDSSYMYLLSPHIHCQLFLLLILLLRLNVPFNVLHPFRYRCMSLTVQVTCYKFYERHTGEHKTKLSEVQFHDGGSPRLELCVDALKSHHKAIMGRRVWLFYC